MKTIKQIYESILIESIKDAVIDKFSKESTDAEYYVNRFWNEIRNKESDSSKKDINYWVKQGFNAFKTYIDGFKSKKEIKRESKNLTEVDNGNGKLITIIDGFELWQVKSYEAAKFLGRFYKNISVPWCISTNNKKFWNHTKYKNARFYFMIYNDPKNIDEKYKDYVKFAIFMIQDVNKYVSILNDKERLYDELPTHIKIIVDKTLPYLKVFKRNKDDDNILFIDYLKANDYDNARAILNTSNIDIYYNDNDILKYAVWNSDLHLLEFLLNIGADIHKNNDELLKYSTDLKTLKYLYDKGLNIKNMSSYKRNMFLKGLKFTNHTDMINFLSTNK